MRGSRGIVGYRKNGVRERKSRVEQARVRTG